MLTQTMSSTLKVSAAGTSSNRVEEHTTRPKSPKRRYLCTLTPRVDFSPVLCGVCVFVCVCVCERAMCERAMCERAMCVRVCMCVCMCMYGVRQ